MFIKREWKNLDKVMLIVSFLIVCISLCIIGSATHINKGAINYDFVAKQGAAFVVDLMIILFFSRFDYAKLKKYAKPLYIINLLMLVAVMFVGTSALGAQRWIQLGPITLQPSEFSKLIMIICTASILSDRVGQLNTWRQVLPIGLYVGIPFLLVLKQPDLGTSLVFLAITFGMLFVGRIKMSLLRNVFLAGVVGLIPNCAASVSITQLYLMGILNAGQMMAGLLVGAGVGLLVLFRTNDHPNENLRITIMLYGLGVFWGLVIEYLGIVF